MPPRSKRTLEEIAQAEDSNDDDYDDRAPGRSPRRARSMRGGGQRARKRAKRGHAYRGSDVDSDDNELQSDDEISFEEYEGDETEELEIKNGRPVRRTAKKQVKYEEDSESEDDELSLSPSEKEDKVTSKKRRQLIVKLPIGRTPATTPNPPRTLRNRSGSYGVKQPASSESKPSAPTRRSSRLSHDEEETVIQLSNSGKHVEIIREGSRDPEGIPDRAYKGGKGLKYPSKSTIDEEGESLQTKQENDDDDDERLVIESSQHEIQESNPQTQEEPDEEPPRLMSDIQAAADEAQEAVGDETMDPLQASPRPDIPVEENEEEDEGPMRRTRATTKRKADSPAEESDSRSKRLRGRTQLTAPTERTTRSRRRAQDESSDFEPEKEQEEEGDISESSNSDVSRKKDSQRSDESTQGRRSRRLREKASRNVSSEDEDDIGAELEELQRDAKKKQRLVREEITFEPRGRRGGKKPNYNLLKGLMQIEDEDEAAAAAPSPSQRARKTGGGGWQRSLFNTSGPFGGGGGLAPVLGGGHPRAQGDVDSDSSDDEVMKQPKLVGGTVGMTPTTATAGGINLLASAQPLNADAAQGPSGTPANLGKVKDRQALADADPLGVDQNVNFDSVGGLQGHIDQLKEMVTLPLLYPEIFMRFKITPPRGVLFHGPPGTGKTLLARALAATTSSQGKKVTFYMRKGADALSKWVGEAERQLRLLFDEARKNQPSIIFFDEIDGLAPVRSSKQEQIHASIVSTLLALMDGMDGRGQVIVIGATNRPDSVDPALRRPGRFDREFYFPLPNTEARRAILDINTKGWHPPLDPTIKDELAKLTKGYGGADLRALCTEAALNAVQRRYPQIYASREKLLIDPKTIEVMPKDFMISIKKIVPSSQRSTGSTSSPLPPTVEPLLTSPLSEIAKILDEIMPKKKQLTALQEAEFEDVADGTGFGRERMQQTFEETRVFRPRLLVSGKFGMGQQYLAAAILNYFEGFHVQSFDQATLLSDSSISPEARLIQLFTEVKLHKPSVVYVPNLREWFETVSPTVISTFMGLLRSLKPTDPVLVLGLLEGDDDDLDDKLRRDLFGYSKRNRYALPQSNHDERFKFFAPITDYVKSSPRDFPDPKNRKKRKPIMLLPAPLEPEKAKAPPTKDELKAQRKKDRHTLNLLKIRLQPIMDQIRMRYKKFRTGVIDEATIRYLYDEADQNVVTSDIPPAVFRPFEIGQDPHGVPGLVDEAGEKFYYNLDAVTIEKRLSNGYYKRPADFLADIKRLAKDAKTIGDEDRLLKANELLSNVEVDIINIEYTDKELVAECERVYQRELAREKEANEKASKAAEERMMPPPQITSNVPRGDSGPSTNTTSDGPISLGEHLHRRNIFARPAPTTPSKVPSNTTSMTNGDHPPRDAAFNTTAATNGSSESVGHRADDEGDTPMGGMGSQPGSNERSNETLQTHTSSSFGNRESAQPRPIHSWTGPSQQLLKEHGLSEQPSQTGALTPVARGTQISEYRNDASTTQTTSGQKNSNSSGHAEHPQSQEEGPNMYLWRERHSAGGSDIPDTQGEPRPSQESDGVISNSSQVQQYGPQPASQERSPQATPPPPPQLHTRPNGHLASILNPEVQPNLIQAEEDKVANMHRDVADKTSGLTVEQLEQVNSVLMDTLWMTRGEWDRGKVLDAVIQAFNDVIADMRDAGQEFGQSSWGRQVGT